MTLLAHAEAAPFAGAAGITGALIFVGFCIVVLYGLQVGWQYTFGAFLRRLADSVDDIWVVGGPLADALDAVDTFVMRQIGRGISSLEYTAGKLWGGLTWLVRETGDALVSFGSDVWAAIDGLVNGEIPTQIVQRTRPLTEGLAARTRIEDRRAIDEARARARGIDRVGRDLQAERIARERGIDYIAGRLRSLERSIPGRIAAEVDALRGWVTRGIGRRLTRVEQLVLGGAITATAVAALTRYFPYWQCTNVRRFNRALCRSPLADWKGLLGLLSFVVVALNPEEMARLADEAVDELSGIIEQMG